MVVVSTPMLYVFELKGNGAGVGSRDDKGEIVGVLEEGVAQ